MVKNKYLSGYPILCQLLSYVPKDLFDQSVEGHSSDRYYKTMTTYKQFVFMFYGVVMRCRSLRNLCKNLLLLENKLSYLGITKLPAVSTLSDANINRSSDVFASLYQQLYSHYKDMLRPVFSGLVKDVPAEKVFCFDSTTIGLFTDVFKGAGRNSVNGKKKGGIKAHSKMPLSGTVPDLVCLGEARCNDKVFLGQLEVQKGEVYIFDKAYLNYGVWEEWDKKGAFFVTRLHGSCQYETVGGTVFHCSGYAGGGVISEKEIVFKGTLRARLVTYLDGESGKVLKFVTNMFGHRAQTIAQLYKYRWNIEVLFKRLKQNFELCYFFSDSPEGIKTQIWVALIAQLIFSVIHWQIKEAEAFATLVNVASNNMGSYVCIVKIMQASKLDEQERDLEILQLSLFETKKGGVFQKTEKPP